MATDIRFARLTASLTADTREYAAGLRDSISVSTSWAEKLKTAVLDKGLSLLIDGAKRAGQALINLGQRFIGLVVDAAPLEGIGMAFGAMADRVGLSLDALRQAAAGTVSDFELMQSANVALTGAGEALGQELGKSLPRLLEIARAAARATGGDVAFLFQSLVSGVKRSSPMLIDNTGLVLKLGEANQALATDLGIAVADLSAEQKQIALLNATTAAGQAMIDQFGGGQQTAAEAIGVFRAQIKNATDQIGLAFLPVLQAIMGPLGEIGGGVGQMVVRWAEKLAGAIIPIARWFGILVTEGDALNDFLTEMPEPLQDIIKRFSPMIEGIVNLVKWVGFFLSEGDPLNDFFAALPGPIREVVEEILPFITGISDLVTAIVSGEEPLGALKRILGELGLDTVAQAVQTLSDIWNEVWPDIQTRVEEVLPIITEFASKIAAWFQEEGPGALESFKAIWAEVWGFVMEQVDTVVAWFQENLPLIEETGEKLAEFWQTRIVPALDNAWNIIKTIVSTAVTIVSGIITTVMQIITGDWEGAWATIKETAASIWEGIKTIVSEFIEGVLNAVGTNIEEFQETWRNNWEMLKTIVTTIWENIVTAVTEKAAEIREGISSFISDAVEAIKTKVSSFVNAGRDLILGLKKGIVDNVQSIIDAVTGAVAGAIAAAKALLGISSRSRVFVAVGHQIDAGLAGGIIGNARAPQMAMAAVAAGVTRMATSTATYNFNQTIHARDSGLAATQGFETMRARVRG